MYFSRESVKLRGFISPQMSFVFFRQLDSYIFSANQDGLHVCFPKARRKAVIGVDGENAAVAHLARAQKHGLPDDEIRFRERIERIVGVLTGRNPPA